MFGRKRGGRDEPRRRNPRLEATTPTFMKSRTLVGSASSRVRAASEERGDVVSDRVRLHQLRRSRRRIRAVLMVFAGLMVVCGLLIQGAIWRVDFAASEQIVTPLDESAYAQAWRDYTAKRPLESIRYFLHGEDWLAFLAQQNPEVQAVRIEAPALFGAHTMIVDIRQPVAVWRAGTQGLYVDGAGVAFARNYFAEPSVAVIDESGVGGVAAEQAVASSQTMAFIGQVVAGIEMTGVGKVEKIVLPPVLLREVDIYLAGRDYRIKANVTRDPGYQAADIVAALRYIDQRQLSPAYVDARVAGKAYFR